MSALPKKLQNDLSGLNFLYIGQGAKKEQSRRSCFHFIHHYVKIEDRDAPGLAIPFTLWPKQGEALQSFLDHRLTICLKARQLGLTWLALAYAVWKMVFGPGYSVVALSKKEDDAKELVRRVKFILRHLPEWLIWEKKKAPPSWRGLTWEATALTVSVYHEGGEPATFQSFTSAPDSGRSFTANLVVLDEWAFQQWAEEIWSAAYPTINRPTGGQVIGLSTMKLGTLFHQLWQEAEEGLNDFKTIFLPWHTDPRRDQAWYEKTKRNMPITYKQEYPATPEEAMQATQGSALPEFSRGIHVCEPFEVPKWWRKWVGHDPGYNNPFAWYWLAVSPDGIVYIYREYTQDYGPDVPKIFYSDQAEEVARMSRTTEISEEGQPVEVYEKIDHVVAGMDAFAKSRETGKTYVDYYYQGGIPTSWGFIKPSTDRKLRLATWHEYLKPFPHPEIEEKMTAKLQIFDTCTKLIETLPKLLLDENDPEKVADDPRIDNPYDAVGIALIDWHVEKSKPPKQEKPLIAAHKDMLARISTRSRRRLT